MKRAILVLAFLFGSVALFAQVHGPAPSVNSFTGRSMSVGPAPSVLSVGPRGFATGPCNATGCIDPNFIPSVNFQTGTVQFGQRFNGHLGRDGHRGHWRNNFGGAYVYAYPYPVYAYPDQGEDQGPDQAQEQQAEPPAPMVYDPRTQLRPAPNPTPADHPQDSAPLTPGNHNMSPVADEQIPVLIVYKDGHEQEIQNYAIVGDTLYDLGNFVAHKIKLADLDLKQTIQKNEQRGVEFNVPASYKPVG